MSNTSQLTRPSRQSHKREISRRLSSQGLRADFTGYRLGRSKWLSREMWFNDWRTRGISGIKLITYGTYFPEVVRKPFHEVQPKKWPLENGMTFDFPGRLLVVLYKFWNETFKNLKSREGRFGFWNQFGDAVLGSVQGLFVDMKTRSEPLLFIPAPLSLCLTKLNRNEGSNHCT